MDPQVPHSSLSCQAERETFICAAELPVGNGLHTVGMASARLYHPIMHQLLCISLATWQPRRGHEPPVPHIGVNNPGGYDRSPCTAPH